MWGTRLHETNKKQTPRFIPTHVGNSVGYDCQTARTAVHPHACGELGYGNADESGCAGSSPRMWGTHVCLIQGHNFGRFIPTHVGNSPGRARGRKLTTVHPHACGELSRSCRETETYNGSSPRMWGTRYNIAEVCLMERFIPTHVGNSEVRAVDPERVPVHPHACGELVDCVLADPINPGSSPRMWGTRLPGRAAPGK